jgi:WD40 repeat protein
MADPSFAVEPSPGAIKVWNLPHAPFGLYSEYGSSNRQLARTLECHTDAVWSLAVQPSNPRRFVSASADGTLRLWDTSLSRANLRSYILPTKPHQPQQQPVAVCFPRAPDTAFNTFFVAGFRGGQVSPSVGILYLSSFTSFALQVFAVFGIDWNG